MDVFDMLMDDHRRVKSQLEHVLSSAGMATLDTDIQQVRETLQLHMRMEEEYLYPVMERFDEVKSLVKEAYNEHRHMRDLLGRLSQGGIQRSDLQAVVRELLEQLNDHVSEEESELFPTAKQKLSRDDIGRITEQMQDLKQREMAKMRT